MPAAMRSMAASISSAGTTSLTRALPSEESTGNVLANMIPRPLSIPPLGLLVIASALAVVSNSQSFTAVAPLGKGTLPFAASCRLINYLLKEVNETESGKGDLK